MITHYKNNTVIFETDRLTVRILRREDIDFYFDMMGNPNVMNLVPLEAMSREESDANFEKMYNLDMATSDKKVWALTLKGQEEFIGIAAYLKNEDKEEEIGYRLREKYWGNGYGTEIARGLIDFGFQTLHFEYITADVDVENERSVKILDKFLTPQKEFFNPRDNCTDRRYKLTREEWNNARS